MSDSLSEQVNVRIAGGPSDEEWDAYVAKLKDTCGMDELLAVYQAAYDRYVEDAK